MVDQPDSDGDFMFDGWEVQYGINPTESAGADGASGNPDNDSYFNGVENIPLLNIDEHQFFFAFDGSYDPRKVYNTSANRPVVTVFNSTPNPACEEASFIIYRYAGIAADYGSPLTVYYSVGGTLEYDADYTLSPAPPDWPRIFSATIPSGEQSVTVTIDAPGVSADEGDVESVVVAITPYSVSPVSQISNPDNWQYVADWQYNRAIITFDHNSLRPTANYNWVQTCEAEPLPIVLTGYDGCGDSLEFIVVDGPSHGSLGTITSIDGSSASVTYTPNTPFCGPDSFTFKVNDGVRDSLPATVTIDVGDPNPLAACGSGHVVLTGVGAQTTITLTGEDSCSAPLTFTVMPDSGPNNGDLGAITPIDAAHASITYEPDSGFQGIDTFWFGVNNCGYGPVYAPVQVIVAPPPFLNAVCWSDRIRLHWIIPEWLVPYVTDFQIKRATSPSGPYTVIHTADASSRSYEDTSVSSSVTYCYVVVIRHQDTCSSVYYESTPSNEKCLSTCSEPPCEEPVITGWIFTDQGFIAGGQAGAFRSYDDPGSVAASPWSFPSVDQRSLRMNFENDYNCTVPPYNPNNQIGTAQAVIAVECDTRMTVTWSGMGERQDTGYELMSLIVNEVPVGSAHAPGGGLGCEGGMGPVISSPEPPQFIDLEPGLHLLKIHAETGDPWFHTNAYYQFDLTFEPL